MNRLPRLFAYGNGKAKEGGGGGGGGGGGRMESNSKQRRPKLDRRNARKNFNYDATSTSSSPSSSSEDPSSALRTRSLDLYPFPGRTSFRVYGEDGEMDEICRTLGLSGPDDFAIPVAAWEARKARCSSDLLPRSRLHQPESPKREEQAEDGERGVEDCLVPVFSDVVRVSDQKCELDDHNLARYKVCDESSKLESGLVGSHLCRSSTNVGAIADKRKLEIWCESSDLCQNSATQGSSSGVGGGIKGVRPPVLAPPPRMLLPVFDNSCSTWDIFRGFAPQDGEKGKASEEDDEVDGSSMRREEVNGVRFGETAVLSESCSFTTSNDDEDSSSTTTEPMYNISPDGRFRRSIKSWQKGDLLGSGSFGTVYEGITDDGFFFAVKEVSLLDQGSQGKQSIYQLEQEIALLSQFEHENIVQYLGTDKDDSKLYIFLEFVTKGSLANLYQKYHLRDSQVSVYTRQILCGLKYLHDRKVVHRDIKCANILVDASGSVKLADFGLAKATKLNDVKSCKGTAFWMAPEVVNGKSSGYGLTADIWSLGCTVLEMLTRQVPYSHLECMPALFKIGKGEPPPIPNNLSKDARNFISQCLQVNPDDRPTAAQLLGHPFVKRPLPTSMGSLSPQTNSRQS